MRVLVAGASGAIGPPVVRELLGRGHEVVAMTATPSKRAALEELGASAIVGDLLDADSLGEALAEAEPEGVVNMASKWRGNPVRFSQVRPANEMRERGTRNLLSAAIASGAQRYVSESMIFIYGYGRHSQPVTEQRPPGSERSRGLQAVIDALVSSERQVREATESGSIEGVSLRFGLFHGPHAPTSQMMFDLIKRRRMPLIGDGSAVHSWIELEDAARAVADALERAPAGNAYNVVDDTPVAIREYLGEIARLIGSKPPRRVPYWLIRPAASYLAVAFGRPVLPVANRKLKDELGWRPAYPSYREALAPLAQ
jgi:nucleoside-diphosphate-sugar epimerase